MAAERDANAKERLAIEVERAEMLTERERQIAADAVSHAAALAKAEVEEAARASRAAEKAEMGAAATAASEAADIEAQLAREARAAALARQQKRADEECASKLSTLSQSRTVAESDLAQSLSRVRQKEAQVAEDAEVGRAAASALQIGRDGEMAAVARVLEEARAAEVAAATRAIEESSATEARQRAAAAVEAKLLLERQERARVLKAEARVRENKLKHLVTNNTVGPTCM
jgi:hypothetical protein